MGNPFGEVGNVFSATINGVEHIAHDMESLVTKATSTLESLGITVTGDVSWLVKFLIEAGEDPVTTISQLSGRITSMGGDVVSTLEELTSGIMTYGLTGFAQKKASQALAPMQEVLQKNSSQGPTIAQVHQTTLKTMRTRLDALTSYNTQGPQVPQTTLAVEGNTLGLIWQGQSADALNTSFDSISGLIKDMTTAFENGGPQDKLNIICGGALAGILVVGGIVLLCEFAVTCIVAIDAGPAALVILGAGASLMEATLAAMAELVAVDLAAWLVGSIAIYTITHIQHSQTTVAPMSKPDVPSGVQLRHWSPWRKASSDQKKIIRENFGDLLDQGVPPDVILYLINLYSSMSLTQIAAMVRCLLSKGYLNPSSQMTYRSAINDKTIARFKSAWNSAAQHLTPADLEGAWKDLNGIPSNGQHLHEVKDALTSLKDLINVINSQPLNDLPANLALIYKNMQDACRNMINYVNRQIYAGKDVEPTSWPSDGFGPFFSQTLKSSGCIKATATTDPP